MKNKQNLLGLFSVIESPILVFGANKELLYELWPRKSSFGYQTTKDGSGKNSDKRNEIRSQAQALLASWQRAIGDPIMLTQPSDIGAIRLFNGSYVFIGPITPLKINLEQVRYIENRTALQACNMWLNLMRDLCRSQVHIATNNLSEHVQDHNNGLHESIIASASPSSSASTSASSSSIPSADNSALAEAKHEAVVGVDHLGQGREQGQEQVQVQGELELGKLKERNLSGSYSYSDDDSTTNSSANIKIKSLYDLLKPMSFDMSAINNAIGMPFNPYDGSIRNEDFNFSEEQFIKSLGISTVSAVQNHNQFRNEVLTSEAVREGNRDKLKWAYNLPPKGQAGILGFTPLRSWQNHAHLQNVLASRAAIDAGITPEEAYRLSDKLYLIVEAISDPLIAKHMRYIVALAFTEQVRAHKNKLKEQGQLGKEEPVFVQKARYYIQQRLCEKLSLEDIALQVDCSAEHLARSFKKFHLKTIMNYITDERIKMAKELLIESNTKIKDIAESLGFCTVSHFCYIFKEKEHISPQQWRKQNAKIIEA